MARVRTIEIPHEDDAGIEIVILCEVGQEHEVEIVDAFEVTASGKLGKPRPEVVKGLSSEQRNRIMDRALDSAMAACESEYLDAMEMRAEQTFEDAWLERAYQQGT